MSFVKTYFKGTKQSPQTHTLRYLVPGEDENGRFYLSKLNRTSFCLYVTFLSSPRKLKNKILFQFQRAIKKAKVDKIVKFLKGKFAGLFPTT